MQEDDKAPSRTCQVKLLPFILSEKKSLDDKGTGYLLS